MEKKKKKNIDNEERQHTKKNKRYDEPLREEKKINPNMKAASLSFGNRRP